MGSIYTGRGPSLRYRKGLVFRGGIYAPPGSPSAWYDASSLGFANGAIVTSWADRTTNGFNGTYAGAGTDITYVTNAQNGLSTVSFPGTPSTRRFSTTLTSVYPLTVAAVVKLTSSNIGVGCPVYASNVANPGITFSTYCSSLGLGGIYADRTSTNTIGQTGDVYSTNAFHLLVWVLNSSSWNLLVDGVSVGSGGAPGAVGANGFDIGAAALGVNGVFQGQMGELIVYTSTLGAFDLNLLHVYAQSKWATP